MENAAKKRPATAATCKVFCSHGGELEGRYSGIKRRPSMTSKMQKNAETAHREGERERGT